MLSVIIPTLNAETGLSDLLGQLTGQFSGQVGEIVVSDGGSTDRTLEIALAAGARIAMGCTGRGFQLVRAAQFARGKWLLFLHADSRLPRNWREEVDQHIKNFPDKAGYFGLKFSAAGFRPHLLGKWVKFRCLVFALPYGDQGLLIRRDLYEKLGGFPDQALFEDVAIIRKLGRRRLRAFSSMLTTSAERYEREGYVRRGSKNLTLLARYLTGADPDMLAERYR